MDFRFLIHIDDFSSIKLQIICWTITVLFKLFITIYLVYQITNSLIINLDIQNL